MARRAPSYRRQRRGGNRSDLAFCELNGRRVYLGVWNSPESRSEYRRILAELASGRPGVIEPRGLTLNELIVLYNDHAKEYFGQGSTELRLLRHAFETLVSLYGHTVAAGFGPLSLRAVREHWIGRGLARTTINSRVGRVRRLFRWAVEHELVPSSTLEGLRAMRGLEKGRSAAREPAPVRPVAESDIEAVLERGGLTPQVAALVRLQLATGARSGEIVGLRPCDLDRTREEVWIADLERHKTAYRGRGRRVCFGPVARSVLEPWLRGRAPSQPLFSPREAQQLVRGHKSVPVRRTTGKPYYRESYSTTSYRSALRNACVKAKVPSFSPHRLRHTAATRIRQFLESEFGFEAGREAARVILGHADLRTTEIYAERDAEAAVRIAERLG